MEHHEPRKAPVPPVLPPRIVPHAATALSRAEGRRLPTSCRALPPLQAHLAGQDIHLVEEEIPIRYFVFPISTFLFFYFNILSL